MKGHVLSKKILREGYYWLTMEKDSIQFVRKCHQCQVHGDLIRSPPVELHAMAALWPFVAWGMDVIGPIAPKASNGHRFILVAIDYFTKWVEAVTFKSVTMKAVIEAKDRFSPNWQGPFVVKKVLPNGALYLTDIEGKMVEMTINTDAVKRYYPGNAPRSSVLIHRGMPRRIMLAENDRDEGPRNRADDTKEDYLSKLSDDVLCSILGKLTLREVAQTTILSTRWRYLSASTQLQQQPPFLFRCLEMFGIDHNIHYRCPYYQEKDKFMNALYQFLRLYCDLRVAEVKLVCCFVREFPSAFTHWFRSISRVGVERLFLSFECLVLVPICDLSKLLKFSLENLSQSSSLEHLFLSHCVVLPSPQVCLNSLTTLALRAVVLKCRHLECILSSCSNLEKLTIEYSKLPYKLRLAGTVKQVVIWRCDGGKEIDLHAEYLHTLECMV
ncbi:hypothetical protein BC332_33883 [Capsicum chinense]|nr:hypothetical protein BC332_33883 [Capsicum chinense]